MTLNLNIFQHARQLVLELINEAPSKSEFKPRGGGGEYGSGGGGMMGGREERGGGGGGGGGFGMETMKFPVPKISVGKYLYNVSKKA
jgi:hypothetical protein